MQHVTNLKLAIVSDAIYPFNPGGKEKRIHDITARLAQAGYDVTIYCMQWWEGEKTIVRDGVTLHAISPYYPLYVSKRRSIKEAIFFSLHCFKLLNKSFDVVEVDHMPYFVLFTVKLVCLIRHKRMIATWHEVVGKDYWKQYIGAKGIIAYWIEKVSVTLPDRIISVSNHTTHALKNVLGTKKDIITIPNGFDAELVRSVLPAESGTDIIFAGRLLAHKNVDILLHAIKILAKTNPSISALIIGNGPEGGMLKNLSIELGIKDNVSFADFFHDQNDLYRAMKAAKVFVLPSTREGFGIVVLEANACGLPVVTIDAALNAAKDLVANGRNGMVVALDPQHLATAINTLLGTEGNAPLYREYAEKYDWKSIVAKVEKVYLS
jgi:glycosyltransferase involved in cell wall biosynthesis